MVPQAGRSTQLGLTCETFKDISEHLARAVGGWGGGCLHLLANFNDGGDFVFSNKYHRNVP